MPKKLTNPAFSRNPKKRKPSFKLTDKDQRMLSLMFQGSGVWAPRGEGGKREARRLAKAGYLEKQSEVDPFRGGPPQDVYYVTQKSNRWWHARVRVKGTIPYEMMGKKKVGNPKRKTNPTKMTKEKTGKLVWRKRGQFLMADAGRWGFFALAKIPPKWSLELMHKGTTSVDVGDFSSKADAQKRAEGWMRDLPTQSDVLLGNPTKRAASRRKANPRKRVARKNPRSLAALTKI